MVWDLGLRSEGFKVSGFTRRRRIGVPLKGSVGDL